METNELKVYDRPKQKRFREKGYIRGVLYGDGMTQSTSIKVQEAQIKKIIAGHGENAKVDIHYGKVNTMGIFKEIQRDPVTWAITHVDIQSISKTHEMKLSVPINFHGRERLVHNGLQLQIQKANIELFGRMDAMPENIDIDVSSLDLKDNVTLADLNIDDRLKVLDNPDMVYATVTHARLRTEEPETKAEAEDAAGTGAVGGAGSGSDEVKK